MLKSVFYRWFFSTFGDEIRERLAEEAKGRLCEGIDAFTSELAAGAQDNASGVIRPEVGLVFAHGSEYGCFLDILKNVRVTKGDGLKYSEGLLDSLRVVIVESGVGEEKARKAAEAVLQVFRPRRMISAGFSGGLISSLKRNQIVIPRTIIEKKSGQSLEIIGNVTGERLLEVEGNKKDGGEQADFQEEGSDSFDRRFTLGTLLTSDEIVASPSEKERLGKEFNASLVDMEGFAIAEVCREKCVPFLSMRVILDPIDEPMPSDLKPLADSSGAILQNPARFLGTLWGTVSKRPSSLIDMYKLKENALVAADTLANSLAEVLRWETAQM